MTKNKVVLVPFPFEDLKAEKLRPAICLNNPIGPHRHVILAFITSRIPDEVLETDIVLNSSEADFAKTGLHVTSTIRLHRLITVTASLIQRELGTLSHKMQTKIIAKLHKLFEN